MSYINFGHPNLLSNSRTTYNYAVLAMSSKYRHFLLITIPSKVLISDKLCQQYFADLITPSVGKLDVLHSQTPPPAEAIPNLDN